MTHTEKLEAVDCLLAELEFADVPVMSPKFRAVARREALACRERLRQRTSPELLQKIHERYMDWYSARGGR